MSRTLSEIIAELPPERRQKIERRYQELKQEIESLRELRKIAGKVQMHVARALKIKQPSVSRLEKQTDMYLSTLRGYVEAVGGELELVVRLPKRPVLHLRHLGDALREHPVPTIRTAVSTVRKRKGKTQAA